MRCQRFFLSQLQAYCNRLLREQSILAKYKCRTGFIHFIIITKQDFEKYDSLDNIDSTKMENHNFKKVRNFQNLYEQHKTHKAKEILERQRIGTKKVWLLEKLPPLEIPQTLKVDQNGRNFDGSIVASSQQLILKRIQRGQEGQLGIESQREVPQIVKEQDLEMILANTKPVLKKNMFHNDNNVIIAFKSFEVLIIDDELSKPRVVNLLYVPLNQVKELLNLGKKQLELKIMECISYEKSTSQFSYKINQKKQQTSPRKKISQVRNKFDEKHSPKKQQNTSDNELPEFIYSSIYVETLGKDFRVTIKLPTIEYLIPAKHFSFIKILQSVDLKEFFDQSFSQWDTILLKNFSSHSKFLEISNNLNKSQAVRASIQLGQTQSKFNSRQSVEQLKLPQQDEYHKTGSKMLTYVFCMDSKLFDSQEQFQEEKVLQMSSKLRGCFDRAGLVGNIQLKSFQLKIKGLSNGYDYKESIEFEDWSKVLNFMRKSAKMDPDNPQQLVDMVGDVFLECLKRELKFNFSCLKQLNHYKKGHSKKSDKKHKRSASMSKIITSYFKLQKRSKMLTSNSQSNQDRYLIELEQDFVFNHYRYPQAKVFLDEEQLLKTLVEADCEYLAEKKFNNWKQYLMNQLYRLELNIGVNEPLPRINEARKEDEGDIFSEGDFREKYPPKDELEQKTIVETRAKLSQWFPL